MRESRPNSANKANFAFNAGASFFRLETDPVQANYGGGESLSLAEALKA
ncbi:MAG: hypothetical protein LBV23_12060 [Deltaproteobacteria bacterium]|nr:hypothetical protein [Deltaproteobacteria bacterium]